MNYGTIKYADIANGPGVRTCLFVSGCRRGCKGCFNFLVQNFNFGEPFTSKTAQDIIDSLAPDYIAGLTVLGGEPMEPENQHGLVDLFERVRRAYPHKAFGATQATPTKKSARAVFTTPTSRIAFWPVLMCWSTALSRKICTTSRCVFAGRPISV